ncbi:hypothetical protein LIER_04436 [Lithospermum erythrorhizon]|uniref:HAT C-terminal dimerisation domain-containing protein n=1 Tax=Lithospermum erythrorhizon TaxID=34254 RepID=A0AAV3NWX1_LITER
MYGFSNAAADLQFAEAEWWYTYGPDAPNLRRIAMRILSQTMSSSGCERNSSTFSLIHTKVRNRLNYKNVERLLAYAHYNMRLKLRHLMNDRKNTDVDYKPIDVAHIFYDDNLLSRWLDAPGDALLDEFDDDGERRPNTFLATWTKRLSRSFDDANEHGDDDPLLMRN